MSRDSSVGIATVYGLTVFDSRQGQDFSLITTAVRSTLKPTQPPIQCSTARLYFGIKATGFQSKG
jgi:hypothetical protein